MLVGLERALSSRRLTAMGPVLSGSGSSQDRPMTPPSPAAEGQALEPTTPIETILPSQPPHDKPDSGQYLRETSVRIPNDGIMRNRWPYVLAPLAALALIGGMFWVFSGGEKTRIDQKPVIASPAPKSNIPKSELKPVVVEKPAPVAAVEPSRDITEEPSHEPTPPVQQPKRITRMFVVETSPKGAMVQVDGKPLGRSPAKYEFTTTDKDKLQRDVKISASARGYRPASSTVKLSDAVRDKKVILKLKRRYRPKSVWKAKPKRPASEPGVRPKRL
ncbi:MAG: PEGA domain-containing protein [Deltaproteobacteria bacterium]|nr:PEGA domain-containing protein [Deltaproteobacteria bacterium]